MFKLIHRLFREELVDMVKEADKRKNGKIDYKCKYRVTIKEWNKVINWFDKVKLLKVKLLLFAYHLGHNVTHPFSLIIITNHWCNLFWSKLSMQKIPKNCHIRLILANWLHQMVNSGPIWQPRVHWRSPWGRLIWLEILGF